MNIRNDWKFSFKLNFYILEAALNGCILKIATTTNLRFNTTRCESSSLSAFTKGKPDFGSRLFFGYKIGTTNDLFFVQLNFRGINYLKLKQPKGRAHVGPHKTPISN